MFNTTKKEEAFDLIIASKVCTNVAVYAGNLFMVVIDKRHRFLNKKFMMIDEVQSDAK